MPRPFMNQGDKLAFRNGIIVLSVAAGVLLWVFGGDTHQLIPLISPIREQDVASNLL